MQQLSWSLRAGGRSGRGERVLDTPQKWYRECMGGQMEGFIHLFSDNGCQEAAIGIPPMRKHRQDGGRQSYKR